MNALLTEEHMKNYKNLASAIVARAAMDYKSAFKWSLKQRRKSQQTLENELIMDSIRKFFNSEWFRMLCDYDGKALQEAIEKQCYEKLGFKNI